MRIKRLGRGDESILDNLTPCFDHPVKDDAVTRFLQSDNHHIFAAIDDNGDPVGFVSGVETTHPDKGTEMFIYELAVHESHRQEGYGKRLVRRWRIRERTRLLLHVGAYGFGQLRRTCDIYCCRRTPGIRTGNALVAV